MSLARASLWTSLSTLTKILCGLLVVKLLAVSYGPAGIGLAGNFRQLITVLGVMAGAGIFNGVTRFTAEYQQQPEKLRALTATSSAIVSGASLLLAFVLLLAAALISEMLFGNEQYRQVIRIVAFLQAGIAWANLLQAQLKGFRDARGNALVVAGGSLLGVGVSAELAGRRLFRSVGRAGSGAGGNPSPGDRDAEGQNAASVALVCSALASADGCAIIPLYLDGNDDGADVTGGLDYDA